MAIPLLSEFDDVGGSFGVSEFGEVITAECEFEEEGLISSFLEFPA